MNLEKFEKLVQTYGSAPHRWPAELRAAAQSFVQENPAGTETVLQSEYSLDAALNGLTQPSVSDLTRQRILNALDVPAAAAVVPQRRKPLFWQAIAATFIGAFSLGFVGANMIPISDVDSAAVQMAENTTDTSLQETAGDLGISDIYEWTYELEES